MTGPGVLGGVLGWSGALVASALMVAACGSSSSDTAPVSAGGPAAAAPGGAGAPAAPGGAGAPAAAQAPCDLLTQADAEKVTGQPVKADPLNGQAGMCGYHTTDNQGFGVSLTVSSWDSIMSAARGAGNAAPTPVSGIGDEAVTNGSHNLYVRKGDQGFLLTTLSQQTLSSPEGQLEQEKELALTVVARFK